MGEGSWEIGGGKGELLFGSHRNVVMNKTAEEFPGLICLINN